MKLLHIASCIRSSWIVAVALPIVMHAQAAGPAPAGASPAADAPEEIYILEDFEVRTTAGSDRTKPDETLGAMRINTRMVESPVSVTVLPHEFVENFMLDEVDDQISYVAGGSLAGERQSGTGGYVSFRGFQPQYYRNGFQRIGIAETVNLERVEVIKGPLAATFGLTEPGGIVNYVTQRPFRKTSMRFKTMYGSYNYQRQEAHLTGPLVKGKLFARFDITFTDTDGLQDFFFNRTTAGSVALLYQPTDNTTITLEIERMNRTMNRGQAGITKVYSSSWVSPVSGKSGQSVTGGIADDLEREGFNPLGPDFRQIRDITTIDLRGEHRINGIFSLRANLQWWERPYEAWGWTTTSSTSSVANYSVSSGNFNNRDPLHDDATAETLQGQVDLLASFKLGPTAHKLLLTTDMSRYEGEDTSWKMSTADRNLLPASVRTLSAANPDFTGYDRSKLTKLVDDTGTERTLAGFLLSERMALGTRALVFASYRRDQLHIDYTDRINTQSSGRKEEWLSSYSFGTNIRVVDEKLVFFANRSTSFTPQVTRDRGTGKLQDVVTAAGYEAGFKGELLNQNLFWTLSAYQITRDDIPQLNPLYVDEDDFSTGVPQYLGSGRERSRGVELEVFADLSHGFSLTTTGAYMDARTIKSLTDPAKEGIVLLRAPRKTGSVSLTYNAESGWMKHIKMGLSARYTSDYIARYGTAGSEVTGTGLVTDDLRLHYGPTNRIEEIRPSALIYDAFVNFRFDTAKYHHTIGLSVKNLADHEWWSASGRRNDGRAIFCNYQIKY